MSYANDINASIDFEHQRRLDKSNFKKLLKKVVFGSVSFQVFVGYEIRILHSKLFPTLNSVSWLFI